MAVILNNRETILKSDDQELAKLCNQFYDDWGQFSDRGLQQCYEEIYYLKKVIGDRKFNKMFEVGVDDGGTAWLYSNLFGAPNSSYYACDIHIKSHIHDIALKTKNISNVDIIPIQADAKTCDLTDFDFVHIDGNHGWEDAKADFDAFWPRILSGGICILHDTCLWEGCVRLKQYVENYYDCITFKGHSLMSGGFGVSAPAEHRQGTGITLVFKD